MPRTPLVLEIPEISKPSSVSGAQIVSLCILFILVIDLFPTTKVILFLTQNLKGQRKVERNKNRTTKKTPTLNPKVSRFVWMCFEDSPGQCDLAALSATGVRLQCVCRSPGEPVKTAESPAPLRVGVWRSGSHGCALLIKPLGGSDVGGQWTTL